MTLEIGAATAHVIARVIARNARWHRLVSLVSTPVFRQSQEAGETRTARLLANAAAHKLTVLYRGYLGLGLSIEQAGSKKRVLFARPACLACGPNRKPNSPNPAPGKLPLGLAIFPLSSALASPAAWSGFPH